MAEIAVAMFDVDEVITALLRPLGGDDEILDHPFDLVVADHRAISGVAEFAVEQRMIVGNAQSTLCRSSRIPPLPSPARSARDRVPAACAR